MGFKCPSCSVDIEDAVSKVEHLARLGVKEEANEALKAALKAEQGKASASAALQTERDTLRLERDTLKAEVIKRDQASERAAAFGEIGIAEGARKGFEVMFASETLGVDGAPSFKDWLAKEETRANPFLSVHYVKPQEQVAAIAATTPAATTAATTTPAATPAQGAQGARPAATTVQSARPQGGLTNVDRGASPPAAGDGGPKTPSEINAYFRSEEYRALPMDKQREKKAELRVATRTDTTRS